MFLHIGSDLIINMKDVVAILDLRSRDYSLATKEFIQLAEAEGRLVDVSTGSPKSFIVSEDKVFLSPISSVTLRKRGESARGEVIAESRLMGSGTGA